MATMVTILRQSLRMLAMAGVRQRSLRVASRVESLEVRRLLSAKRSYDQLREERGRHADEDHSHDHRLEVDGFPLPTTTPVGSGGPSAAPPFDLAQTFLLASRPSATKTIYLDFTGHTTSGTWWNSSFNSNEAFTTPAYSIDSDSEFSDTELERIQMVWQRVAEDFAPFDVNVTTADPGTAAITRNGSGDNRWGVRVVIGGAWSDWFGSSAGGVAYLNTFGSSLDMGVFVFSQNLGNNEKSIAEAVSHEVGHAIGLDHDGASGTGYYSGHGSGPTGWAPIMGVGYYRELTQWSRGEYSGANNKEDDLSILTTFSGFSYRPDDFGNTRETADLLQNTLSGQVRTVNTQGVIERNTDQDWFRFTTSGGSVSLNINGASRGSNLDIAATLFNAAGQMVQISNSPDSTSATISASLQAGVYYLMIDGVGARGLSDGYSDYGSLGQYFITGSYPDNGSDGNGDEGSGGSGYSGPAPVGNSSITGRIWHDADGDARVDAGDIGLAGVTVYADANNNGVFDSATEFSAITGADGTYTLTGLAAGRQRIRQVIPDGFAQVYPRLNAARLVTVGIGRTLARIDFRNLRPPEIGSVGSSVTYNARSAPVVVAPTAIVTDADSTSFRSFRLTAQVIGNANSYDRLSVLHSGDGPGQVGVTGSSIRFSGVRVATVSGGAGAGKLTITFNALATRQAVEAVLRRIGFRSLASSPPLAQRTVQFNFIEPNGAAASAVSKSIQLLPA